MGGPGAVERTVVVVDDGSGPAFRGIFQACAAAGCDVIGHPTNRGKGYALKRGFAYVADRYPGRDVVCADCDGQHTLADITRVAEAVGEHRDGIVLGARAFVGDVPARSRFGNDLTRLVFRLSTGRRLQDTQTGLRGYPASMLPWLQTITGDRFEYELDVLLAAHRVGYAFHEVDIETVYLDDNASSHFDPIRDSIRVYIPFVKFSLSSLGAFVIDIVFFLVLMALTANLVTAVVVARTVSATVNYLANRRLVFTGCRRSHRSTALCYGSLVVAIAGANYALLHLLTEVGSVPLTVAKLATELTLFLLSYRLQQRVVFGGLARTRPTHSEFAAPPEVAGVG